MATPSKVALAARVADLERVLRDARDQAVGQGALSADQQAQIRALLGEAAPRKAPACPKCGKSDDLYITETFTASHKVVYTPDTEVIGIENAILRACGWGTADRISDGDCDYRAVCGGCGHGADPADFSMGDPGEWNWEPVHQTRGGR